MSDLIWNVAPRDVAVPVEINGAWYCATPHHLGDRWIWVHRSPGFQDAREWGYEAQYRDATDPRLLVGLGRELPPVPQPRRWSGVLRSTEGLLSIGKGRFHWWDAPKKRWLIVSVASTEIAKWLLAHEGPDGLPPNADGAVTLPEEDSDAR